MQVRRYDVLDYAMSALPHCSPGLPSLPDVAYSLLRAQLESMYLEELAEETAEQGEEERPTPATCSLTRLIVPVSPPPCRGSRALP